MPSSLAEQSSLLNSVAVLGTGTLSIDVIVIPSEISYPWMLPKSLILDEIQNLDAGNRIYNWNQQDLALYKLCSDSVEKVDLLVVESVADPYRVGLAYNGSITEHQVKLKDVVDVSEDLNDSSHYLTQLVEYNKAYYQIPALDKLSHELVDLDR